MTNRLQQLFEYLVRASGNKLVAHIRESKFIATLLFMMTSGGLIHIMQKSNIRRFW